MAPPVATAFPDPDSDDGFRARLDTLFNGGRVKFDSHLRGPTHHTSPPFSFDDQDQPPRLHRTYSYSGQGRRYNPRDDADDEQVPRPRPRSPSRARRYDPLGDSGETGIPRSTFKPEPRHRPQSGREGYDPRSTADKTGVPRSSSHPKTYHIRVDIDDLSAPLPTYMLDPTALPPPRQRSRHRPSPRHSRSNRHTSGLNNDSRYYYHDEDVFTRDDFGADTAGFSYRATTHTYDPYPQAYDPYTTGLANPDLPERLSSSSRKQESARRAHRRAARRAREAEEVAAAAEAAYRAQQQCHDTAPPPPLRKSRTHHYVPKSRETKSRENTKARIVPELGGEWLWDEQRKYVWTGWMEWTDNGVVYQQQGKKWAGEGGLQEELHIQREEERRRKYMEKMERKMERTREWEVEVDINMRSWKKEAW